VFSVYISTVDILYFGSFKPSITLLYPFISYHPFFNSFQYIFLYSLPSQNLCFTIVLFSFPSFPKYHRVVQLLQSCCMSLYMTMFVFVYLFISCIYLPHLRENMHLLSFCTWLTSLNMMSSNCTHLPPNSCFYSL
jgi:hypothetical protein